MSEQASHTDLEIRPLRPGDSIEQITTLLHRAYAGLAADGFSYVATHQSTEITASRLQSGEPFVALTDNRIVGTITLYTTSNDPDAPAIYLHDGSAYFGQFGIEPSVQGRGIGTAMLRFLEDVAVKKGIETIALDTAEGASRLIAWYQAEGYRIVDHADWSMTNYRSVIMAKALRR